MAYLYGKWRKTAELESKLRGLGYSEVVLLDSMVEINGRVNYFQPNFSISSSSHLRVFERATLDDMMRSAGLLHYKKSKAGKFKLSNLRKLREICENSMKITELMLRWSKLNLDYVLVVPDFVMEEQKYVSYRKVGYSRDFSGWVRQLNYSKEINYVQYRTIFSGVGRMPEVNQRKLPQEHRELLKGCCLRDPGDTRLVLTSLHLLNNTDLNVTILSDDTKDFNNLVKTSLSRYSVRGRRVQVQTTSELCDRLKRDGIKLPTKPSGYEKKEIKQIRERWRKQFQRIR